MIQTVTTAVSQFFTMNFNYNNDVQIGPGDLLHSKCYLQPELSLDIEILTLNRWYYEEANTVVNS